MTTTILIVAAYLALALATAVFVTVAELESKPYADPVDCAGWGVFCGLIWPGTWFVVVGRGCLLALASFAERFVDDQ